LLPCSDRSAGQRNQPSHSTVLARPVRLFVCVSAASFPCARPLLPSSDRSAGQRNQPSHSTVLARPVCLFVCESASFPCARPLLKKKKTNNDGARGKWARRKRRPFEKIRWCSLGNPLRRFAQTRPAPRGKLGRCRTLAGGGRAGTRWVSHAAGGIALAARLFPGANSAGPVCFLQRPLQDVDWWDAGAGTPNNSAVRACASAAARTAISQRRGGEGCKHMHPRGASGLLGTASKTSTACKGNRGC
jgi:hypothetical protein